MCRALTALTVAVAVGAPAVWGQDDAKQKAVAKELKNLEGTWEVVFVEVGGKKGQLPGDRKERLIFRGADFTVMQGEEVKDKGTLKIDPTAKPKSLDFKSSGDAGKAGASLAIYELKGDELRVCIASPGEKRPAAFTTGADGKHYITTLHRMKGR
jgi:uncharacterized protein (TIGR03067 family)